MKNLYSLVPTVEKEKIGLYVKGVYKFDSDTLLTMKKGDVADFTTYFNSFSVKKWKRYTTLKELTLQLKGEGDFAIIIEQLLSDGKVIKHPLTMEMGTFSHTFEIENLSGDILGFSIKCLSDTGKITEGGWYGEFEKWEEKRIGISIATFKRENYVKKNISTLRTFQKVNPWLDILVVDNGSTLNEQEEEGFRIVHNRNFGGSGGFTRGMIEYVEDGSMDYVLLMDDDIVLEPSAIERTHSLLCGLKEKYKESFLAGAMFSLENPAIQHENTSYWRRFVSYVCHKDLDCTNVESLVENETFHTNSNAYAGWWYCCIPLGRIHDIGYPIPVFIKSDDMEYGIRNQREVLSLNGVAVWHEDFANKLNPVMMLFSDRNSFILNHYAYGCGRMTLFLAVILRLIRRGINCDGQRIRILLAALREYAQGFDGLVSTPGDEKFQEYREMKLEKSVFSAVFNIGILTCKILCRYGKLDKSYKNFRTEKLKSSSFWKNYLRI